MTSLQVLTSETIGMTLRPQMTSFVQEPCKWRAKIRLNRPDIKISNPAYVNIENYTVLVNSKAHPHHFSCQSYAKTHVPFDEPRENC